MQWTGSEDEEDLEDLTPAAEASDDAGDSPDAEGAGGAQEAGSGQRGWVSAAQADAHSNGVTDRKCARSRSADTAVTVSGQDPAALVYNWIC